jgi:hypothetical protein
MSTGVMLYRYLSEEFALKSLQTRSLKVGRLNDLNDPADCQPILVNGPIFPDLKATIAFEAAYLTSIYRDIGIACFSKSLSDPNGAKLRLR